MTFTAWWEKYGRRLEIIGLVLILAAGLFLRLEDIRDWRSQPERAFFQGEPLLTTHDGYYYLSLARDLANDTYLPIDEKRAVPESPRRPSPPPLLSVLGAGVHMLTSLSLNWVGVLLPSFLGILVAIPVYLLGRYYDGPVMGLSAALAVLCSEYYMYRSSLGWFDTDGMNVTFTMAVAYCFLRFGVVPERRRYLYLLGGFVLYGFFFWWWDSTPEIVTAISLFPLLVALAFFYRPPRKEGILFFSVVAGCLLVLFVTTGLEYPGRIMISLTNQFGYITKSVRNSFPNMSMTVSEQEFTSIAEIVRRTTTSMPVFVLAWIGLILLFIRKPKESLYLLVPLVIAALSFFYARRFLVFMAPLHGLGLGFLVSSVWGMRSRWKFCAALAPVLLILVTTPSIVSALAKTNWPKVHPLVVSGMDLAARQTPEDAVIWAWWDQGYPLRYWARRGTIADGTFHDGELAVYNAIPLATDDFRTAANFIQFYVVRGTKGMLQLARALHNDKARGMELAKEVFSAGPAEGRAIIEAASLLPQGEWQSVDDWLRFFFPPDPRPIYLFLESRLIVTDYWWYWLGTWDVAKKDGKHLYYKPFAHVEITDEWARNDKGLNVDLVEGTAVIGNKKVPLKQVVVRGEESKIKFHTFHEKGINFEIFLPVKYAVLADTDIAESVFNKLYLRHIGPKEDYFRPVDLLTPAYQFWKVKGDQISDLEENKGTDQDVL